MCTCVCVCVCVTEATLAPLVSSLSKYVPSAADDCIVYTCTETPSPYIMLLRRRGFRRRLDAPPRRPYYYIIIMT